MKLIVLSLFLTAILYSQQAKVTAYRLINPVDDGPCSIKSYTEHADVFSGSYVTAESDDPKLIEKLLEIKAECKNWPYKPFYCNNRMIGGDEIRNMVVITGKRNDTIFTDRDNQWIIFPERRKACLDQNGILKASLTGRIKEFFDYDFDKQLRVKEGIETLDSISIGHLRYRDRALTQNYTLEVPYSVSNVRPGSEKSLSSRDFYVVGLDTIFFSHPLTSIIINDRASSFNVNGIRPGDSEEVLKKTYPISSATPVFYHTRFEEMRRNYYYVVYIHEGKGSILFLMKNAIIDSILINLSGRYYLKP